MILALVAVLLAGLAAVVGVRPGPSQGAHALSGSSSPTLTSDSRLRAAAQVLLDRRATAVTRHDRAAYAATLADPEGAYGRGELEAYDRMLQLPIAKVSFRVTSVQERSGGTARVEAEGRYLLTGYDRAPHRYDTSFGLARHDGAWGLAAAPAGPGDVVDDAQPWDLFGLHVVSSRSTLVVGNVPVRQLTAYRDQVDAAHATIAATWRRPWPGRVVVVAPATTAQMRALLGDEAGRVDTVAAVTSSRVDPGDVATSDRVVVNPEAFADLTTAGRQEVLAHEATHVAVRSSVAGTVPLWLSEGIAELVGYAAAHVDDDVVTAALHAHVRSHGLPTGLPADDAFDKPGAAVAYNEGWAAARLIDRQVGAAGLTRFYLEVASAEPYAQVLVPTERAFESVLGTSQAEFTRRWRAEIRALTS